MKITKSQLNQIIDEELGRWVRGVDTESPEFKKWQSRQKPTALGKELEQWKSGKELEQGRSLEIRVTRLERKLDEILQSLGRTESGTTQVELEEQK